MTEEDRNTTRQKRVENIGAWFFLAVYAALSGALYFFVRHLDHGWQQIIWSAAWIPTGYLAYRAKAALQQYIR